MNNNACIRLSTDNKSWFISIPLTDNYQFQMDRTALMVSKKEQPRYGSVIGFYIYQQDNYNNINKDYLGNTSNVTENEQFNYQIENIYNYEFKTYCIRYKDDNTVNKVYIYKTNDEIVGQVELQKIGATKPEDYTMEDVSPYLGFLVNTEVEIETGTDSTYDPEIIDSGLDPNEVITDLTQIGGTSKLLLIMTGLFVLFGIGIYIYDNDMLFVSVTAGGGFALMFLVMYFIKTGISKSNLKKIDLDALRDEIARGCQAYPGIQTYFTKDKIISNHYHAFVARYEDVVWVYTVDKQSNGVNCGTDIVVALINKKKEAIPYNDEVWDTILKNCPDAIVGFSFKNKKAYKQICKNNTR